VNAVNTKPTRRTQILRWVGSFLAFGLLIYLFASQGWDEILATFRQISAERLLLGILLIMVSRFAVAWRWHVLLQAVEDVSWQKSIRITFAGLFASNFLPTTIGGDVVRLAGAIQLNINGAVSAASLVVDRLIGMFGMILAIPFGAGPLLIWFRTQTPTSGLSPGMASVWFGKQWGRFFKLFQQMLATVQVWFKHPKSLIFSLLFTGIHMLCLFGTIVLLLDDMGESMSLWLAGGLWSFVYFITLLPISINGYGVQEISMTFIFTQVGGISMQGSLAISLLVRTIQMLVSLPGALFVPGIMAGSKESDKA
jgi:glycosyltransferase 2 family protein